MSISLPSRSSLWLITLVGALFFWSFTISAEPKANVVASSAAASSDAASSDVASSATSTSNAAPSSETPGPTAIPGAHNEPALSSCFDQHTLGQEARVEQRYDVAAQHFLACSASHCPQLVRADCEQWRAEVQREQPYVLFVFDTHQDLSGLRATANGVALQLHSGANVPLKPGAVRLRFELPGHQAVEQLLQLQPGSRARVNIHFQRSIAQQPAAPKAPLVAKAAPATRSIPTLSWLLGGVSLASAGAATYLGVSSLQRQNRLQQECSPLCAPERVRGLRQQALWTDITLGVSLGSAALAVLAYFEPEVDASKHAPRSAQASSQWSLAVAPRDVSLAWGSEF